jgi:hypothetical protein
VASRASPVLSCSTVFRDDPQIEPEANEESAKFPGVAEHDTKLAEVLWGCGLRIARSISASESHAEKAFFRYKTIFGERLRAKRDEAQKREAAFGSAVLNRMRELARPQSYPVG